MFLTNYDATRVERKITEYAVISTFVKKPAQNREKALMETTEREGGQKKREIMYVSLYVCVCVRESEKQRKILVTIMWSE